MSVCWRGCVLANVQRASARQAAALNSCTDIRPPPSTSPLARKSPPCTSTPWQELGFTVGVIVMAQIWGWGYGPGQRLAYDVFTAQELY